MERRAQEQEEALFERLAADFRGAGLRSVDAYVGLFPGREAEVRREHAWLRALGPSDDEPPSGLGFPGFEVLGVLGRGGQGVVYAALDRQLGRRVALKVLTRYGSDDGGVERFLREARLASRLEHPDICRIHQWGVSDDGPYLAMQLVDGVALARVIGAGERVGSLQPRPATRDDVDAALLFVERVARALAFAHRAGIVHRDVKPANVLVRPSGAPVLCDFGLARELADEHGITVSGALVGTPAYLPPECIGGVTGCFDERGDVYAVGLLAYELLTGQRAFAAATRDELFGSIRAGEVVDPRRLNPALNTDVATVLATAIEVDPNRRYASAENLAGDLRAILERRPIAARRAGYWLRLRRWCERNPLAAVSTMAVVLLLSSALALTALWLAESNRLRARERARTLQYERLAAAGRLDDLLSDAGAALWVADEEHVAPMRDWLRRARALVADLPFHEQALREAGTPEDEPPAATGRRSPESAAELDELRSRRDALRAEVTARERAGLDGQGAWQQVLAEVEGELEELQHQQDRLTRRPATPERWRRDRLARLVARLRALRDGGGGGVSIPAIEHRLELALRARAETLERPVVAWRKVAAAVATDPRFDGLLLRPIEGLVPLGTDAATGLPECAVYGSGTIPTLGAPPAAGDALVLVLVPGGVETLGASRGDDQAVAFGNEGRRRVRLAPYWIGKYEVTQAQWQALMSTTPWKSGPGRQRLRPVAGRTHPVENIDWYGAREFARRLGLELPTEAQWEAACRAGSRARYAYGDDPRSLVGHENIADQDAPLPFLDRAAWHDGYAMHAPVGSFAPNAYGLYDMHGNVSEWCRDCYDPSPPTDELSVGDGLDVLANGPERVSRGGNWSSLPAYARASMRSFNLPDLRSAAVGFRVVRQASP